MVSKNTICLWYDGSALDAATFYAATFPDSTVGAPNSSSDSATALVEFLVRLKVQDEAVIFAAFAGCGSLGRSRL